MVIQLKNNMAANWEHKLLISVQEEQKLKENGHKI